VSLVLLCSSTTAQQQNNNNGLETSTAAVAEPLPAPAQPPQASQQANSPLGAPFPAPFSPAAPVTTSSEQQQQHGPPAESASAFLSNLFSNLGLPSQPQKQHHAHANAAARPPFATSISGEGGPPVGATPIGATGTSTLTLTSLASTDVNAICNDGSPAGYYYAPATIPSAKNLWLVYLVRSHGRFPRRARRRQAGCSLTL